MGARYYNNKKQEVDTLGKLTVWSMKKWGYLNFGKEETLVWYLDAERGGNEYFQVVYIRTSNALIEKKRFHYKIYLVATRCYFGGSRYWFLCPSLCGRKVGILYLLNDRFACRHCHYLTYKSRNENHRYKWFDLLEILDKEQKMQKELEQIKRKMYGGRFTARYTRYLERYSELRESANTINKKWDVLNEIKK